MSQFKVKGHVTPKPLKRMFPENEIIYTAEVYTSGRTWSDGIISISLTLGIDHREFVELMKTKFDCYEYSFALYFPTKKICEKAIEFMETLTILKKLS